MSSWQRNTSARRVVCDAARETVRSHRRSLRDADYVTSAAAIPKAAKLTTNAFSAIVALQADKKKENHHGLAKRT
jgi:hypothetical protein